MGDAYSDDVRLEYIAFMEDETGPLRYDIRF